MNGNAAPTQQMLFYTQSMLDSGCLRGNKVCFCGVYTQRSKQYTTENLPTRSRTHSGLPPQSSDVNKRIKMRRRGNSRPWYEKHTPCVELGLGEVVKLEVIIAKHEA